MRIGILAYRTRTGLGYQCRDYYKHLPVTKVLVIDLSMHNGLQLNDWYPDAQVSHGYPTDQDLEQFLTDIDVVLLAETPLNYNLYKIARTRNIKTAVVANWEFWDYYKRPLLYRPDLIIMPSVWFLDEAESFGRAWKIPVVQLHHPVDRELHPFRLRTGRKFIHIAGKPAVYDRNGTMDYLRADPKGTVITQSPEYAARLRQRFSGARVIQNVEDNAAMYSYGDVLVFPRRYGGNCLPLNEALSSGMPVIMPDISPNNHLLPPEWLVPAHYAGYFEPRAKVDYYCVNVPELAQKLDYFRECDMATESKKADEIAHEISWEVMKPRYLEALGNLL